MSVLRGKALPLVQSPMEYARVAPSALAFLARHGRPDVLINAVGAGIGDDLLCTAIFRELQTRGRKNFWVRSKYPELYEHNDDVNVLVPTLNRYDSVLEQLGTNVICPWYTSYNAAYDRDDPIPAQHLISVMCQRIGITGTIALRPYLTLTPEEAAGGRIAPRQIAIQSSGLDAKHAMRNKNWSIDGYQRVVDALVPHYDVVQIGSTNDPLLEGARDMRGKTSIRGTAAILSQSLAFVGQVGFLMHLARAVDCRSVIVYGGRETPAQSGYPCNENLYSAVHCSPCWLLNRCPYDRMCLEMIAVADVVAAVDRQVERHGAPLACDTDTITEEHIAQSAARYKEASLAHEALWSMLYPAMFSITTPGKTPQPDDPRMRAALGASTVDHPDGGSLVAGVEPTGLLRVHRTLTGRGQVYDRDELLGEVVYALKDAEELIHDWNAAPGKQDRPVAGERIIFGVATSSQVKVLGRHVGGRLRLQLQDGRQLHCTVTKVLNSEMLLIQALEQLP